MNKNELVEKVSTETHLTKADCQRVIDATIELTKSAVKKGDDVRLIGFGTFLRSKRAARRGRNPQTGKEIQIKAHWAPRFRAGKEFKAFVQ